MLFFSNEKCTNDFYRSTNDVTLKKCTAESHTYTAIDEGLVHRSLADKSCTMHMAQKIRGQSAQSAAHPLSHKTIYLTVSSQPIDVDLEI